MDSIKIIKRKKLLFDQYQQLKDDPKNNASNEKQCEGFFIIPLSLIKKWIVQLLAG